ncbi:MAG: GTPase, partial [Oscillospiraceae bacterium]
RDIIEETVNIGDIMLRLSDTAGIRDTLNEVEKVGVELAIKKIETTSLVLAVFDSSNEITQEDKNIIEIAKNKPSIAIINKTDLPSKIDIDYIKENFNSIIMISAKDENEINRLAEAIHEKLKIENINPNEGIIANERQRLCTITALEYIKSAIDDLQMGVTLDAITVTIESAIESLLELTGQKVTEEVVNNVFAHFCVGK